MFMRRKKRLLLGSLMGLIMSACALTPPTDRAGSEAGEGSLADTAWVVDQLGEESSSALQALTLDFAGSKRINGHDGCNVFSGNVTLDDSTIRIEDKMIGTMMACPDAVEARARAYRAALIQSTRYRIQGKQLHLIDSAGNVLVSLTPAEVSLAGSSWDAISYNNGKQAIVSVITGTKITVRFGEDGRITGHAGCNAYFAAYSVQERGMTIQPPGSTRRACLELEGVMEQETLYLQALPAATQYRVSRNRLELRDAHGSLVATFARTNR